MSSTYVISFIPLFGGVGMYDVYIVSSVGESTNSCGTSVFIVACCEIVLLYSTSRPAPSNLMAILIERDQTLILHI